MCGRYVEVQKVEVVEKRFNVKAPPEFPFEGSYNIGPGTMAPVITNDKPQQLQLFKFGMTPFWAKKPMYLFNARSEGDKNKENDPQYTGSKEIFKKPAFRKPIRSQRCLVPADAFIEGTTKEKLSKPYVVYLKERERPFAFAGIWDTWVNKETGKILNSFAIITTTPNTLLQKLPHHRSPVILDRDDEKYWLDTELPLGDALSLLRPYPSDAMNAYRIDPEIKHPRSDGRELIEPIGERLTPEYEAKFWIDLELQGMKRR